MNGLVIRSPWVDMILARKKTWEIRGEKTNIRGTIALIRGGSGLIVGTCELVDVVGPLTLRQIQKKARKTGEAASQWRYKPYERTYAWVLRRARRFRVPRPYKHPPGAVVWVKLPCLQRKQAFRRRRHD